MSPSKDQFIPVAMLLCKTMAIIQNRIVTVPFLCKILPLKYASSEIGKWITLNINIFQLENSTDE